jgi:hypothetical protein
MTDVAPDPDEPVAKKSVSKKSGKKSGAKKPPAKKSTAKKSSPSQKAPAKKTPAQKAAPTHDTEEIDVESRILDDPTEDRVAVPLLLPAPEPPEQDQPDPPDQPEEQVSGAEPSRIDRAKVLAARVEARGRVTYEGIKAQRAESRTIDSVFAAAERDEHVGGGILAAAVAFRLFLFLVPFVFVIVVVFGIGTDISGESTQSAARSAGAVGLLAKSFASVSGGSLWDRLVSFVVGSFALWLTTRSVLKVLRVVSGLTWQVPVPKLPNPTRAAGIFVGVIIGALLLTQLIGVLREASFIAGVLATALFVLVPAGLWLLFSLRAFPHAEEAGWKTMVPGSLLVGVGIELLHLFTIIWIAHQVDSKSETYGAIGIALALLFWAYLLGRILTAGMTLNAALWYRDRTRPELDEPGAR